jgi:hypothetical protein
MTDCDHPVPALLASPDDIFVTISDEKEVNSNNLQLEEELGNDYPYRFTDLATGQPYKRPTEKSIQDSKSCNMCFRAFPTFTEREKHKSRPCWQAELGPVAEDTKIIRVAFRKSNLSLIEDCLKACELEVREEKSMSDFELSFDVRIELFEISMRRLYFAQISKYNLEQWYEKLFALSATQKSIIIPLSEKQLKLVRTLCSCQLSNSLGFSSRMSNQELQDREELEQLISSHMEAGNYFVKLSTRSPKDAIAVKDDPSLSPTEQLNQKIKALMVRNGEEVLNLISRSQRIYSDINFFFQYGVPGTSFSSLNLILREWVDIPQDREFRCFVYEGTVTGVSQYNCYRPMPQLWDMDLINKISESIVKFNDTVKSCFSTTSYVLDVVVFEDLKVELIEINSFGTYMSSGSALFHWKHHEDLLYNKLGRSTPAFRLLTNNTMVI